MLRKNIHQTAILVLLLLPAVGFAGAKSKAPAAFERFKGNDRPLYPHPTIGAVRGARTDFSGAVVLARDPESGIAVYKTAAPSEKSALTASLRKKGLSEIPGYITADGRWVVPTDQLIVQFRKNAAGDEIDAFLAANNAAMVRARRNHPNQFVVRIADPAAAMSTALEWQRSELVEWAQANSLREARPRLIPNDTYFFAQWYLNNTNQNGSVLNRDLGAEHAWNITRGDTNVIVAVLDDGLERTHPDIAANVFSNSAELVNALDDDLNGYTNDYWGWDFWDNDNDSSPANTNDAHGQATSGLIVASADNGLGIAGMANLCRLLPIRVYSKYVSKDINWADSVEYAAQFADVISISYFIDPLPASYEAIRYAVTSGRGGKGCVVCAAFGNEGVMRRYLADLAAEPEVFGVSGTSNYDKRSWFGDYGPSLRVVGPAGGGNIAIGSTDRMGINGYDPTDYTLNTLQGTSFSCPLAAGVAALIISEHPTWSGLAVRRQIEATCDKVDAETFPYNDRGWNEQYGFGRLNAWAALTTTPEPWDSFEPDNTSATAKPIEDGEMQYRSLSTGADEDWVRIVVSNTFDLQLTVVGTTNAGLELYNSALTLIATNNSGWPSYCHLSTNGLSATTYYARVFSPPNAAISNYALHFGVSNLKDEYEPDDVLASARPIGPRAMQYHTLYPGTEDDWVTFTLPRSAHVRIWTMGEIGGDTEIWLKNAGGTTIAYNDDGPYNAPYSYLSNSLSAATYYVQVKEYWLAALPTYQILLEVYDIDNYETNNTSTQATSISSGDRLYNSLYPGGDQDWFTFTVSNRANALLLTDSPNPFWGGDTVLTLYDSNLVEVAQNDEGNDYSYSAIFVTNLAAGTYFAKVEGFGGSVDPDYYLSLDVYNSEARLSTIQPATNGVGITWTGDASFSYRVEAAIDLEWNTVTNLEGRVGENRWIDQDAEPARWYRVVAP